MGIGQFFKEIGDTVSSAVDVVNRYTDPFYHKFNSPLDMVRTGQTVPTAPSGQPVSDPLSTFTNQQVERASAAMGWLYNKGIAQPISTFMLNTGSQQGDLFSASAWAKSWRAANYITPVPAFVLSAESGLNFSNSPNLKRPSDLAIDSPLVYYQPATSFLPPGFSKLAYPAQQQVLRAAGMPAVGNQYVEQQRRNSALFKYGTDAGDAALGFFMDPTVLAGRAFSAVKDVRIRQIRPEGGWSGQQISDIMAKSKMTKAIDWIWENKDNPQLLNNSEFARQSALGPRFGSIVSSLQDKGEVGLFIRTGLGDVDAQRLLSAQNKLAQARIEAPTSRLAGLGGRLAATEDPRMQAVIQSEMDRLSDARNADQAMYDRYNAILSHANEIDQLNLTRWSFARAEARTEAQNAYRAGAALGGGAKREVLPYGAQHAAVVGGKAVYTSTPIDGGFAKSHLYGTDGFFGGPATLVRMLKNAKPNGYIDINDLTDDAVNELRGHLARIPGITAQTRQGIVNDYIKAGNEMDRKDILQQVGALGAAKIAQKHGLSAEYGNAIYGEHVSRQAAYRNAMAAKLGAANPSAKLAENERYTGALDLERTAEAGHPIYLDELPGEGGEITVTPFTASRLMNSHILQDLDVMDKVLGRHASALGALSAGAGTARDAVADSADYLSYLWKFSTLFRLGYIPRVLSDDLSGQVARLGAAAMAARARWGIKNSATNLALWVEKQGIPAREAVAQQGLEYANGELEHLRPQMEAVRASGDTAALAEMETQAAHLELQAEVAQQRLDELAARRAQGKVRQGNQPVTVGGQEFAPAVGGEGGDIWNQRISSSDAISHIFEDNRLLIQGNLERSFSHGAKPITAAQDPAAHADAWTHAINNVTMQDAASRMAVQGASAEQIAKWMTSTAEGRAYRARLPKMVATEDLARSIKLEADQYVNTPDIRAKALEPDGVNPKFLQEATPNVHDRPQVDIAQLGAVSLRHANALDRVIQRWYKVAAEIPADRMSRHPLFNQLYEGHLNSIVGTRMKQGAWEDRTVDDVSQATEAARRLAYKDMRRLVFDVAHRSDASAALRFMSPFFTATAEAFQRWGRILADRPQVAGYAARFYNAPLAAGAMQDADGNHIMPDGTIIDPTTGKRTLVPKSDRYIVVRMPGFLSKMMGYGAAPGYLKLSQNSMNLITQGDPWFNPGVGPVVQVPVDQFVADKPKLAEISTKLGITPFGPSGKDLVGSIEDQFTPVPVKDLRTAFDSSDERYQQVKLQIMQQAAYEHANMGVPMPSKAQLAARVKHYWEFTALSSFLQPMATQRADGYQFFRDQYNNLRRTNPLTADDEYLKRYGSSHFVFAQAMSQNAGGIPATMNAVALEQKYGSLIAKNPDLAPLLIGPNGKGPFSPTAYSYELNNPLTPGDAEMMRTKMTADQAMQDNQRRLGWANFTKTMNWLTSQLHSQGYSSFSDPGAEQLKAMKQAYISAYAEPLLPDGTANPTYNAAWSKDWFSFDPVKYERIIPGLTKVAFSDLARQPVRSDLRVLQRYLGARQELVRQLSARKADGGSAVLTAQSNADLQQVWIKVVDGLVESNTQFGDLYHRYLQRDLGVDAVPQTSGEAA